MKTRTHGWILAGLLTAFAAVAIFAPGPVQAQVNNVKNYFAACSGALPCDNVLNVKGTMTIASTATLTGVVTAPSNATYKVARGEVTLDGSNPSTAATGLTTIVACSATLKSTAAPGDDPSWNSINYTGSDGNLDVYAWKNTGGTDPTLVASTNNTAVFSWTCVGT